MRGDYSVKKALLVGNGFTLNLITEYNNHAMMQEFNNHISDLIVRIESEFDIFRKHEFKRNDLYTISQATFCGDNLFSGSDVYSSSDGICFNKYVEEWIIEKLKLLGFEEPTKVYEDYFKTYGLIYSIVEEKVMGIESYLKVVSLFEKIGRFSTDEYNQIKVIANTVYYNNGSHGKNSINNSSFEISKLDSLLVEFQDIFTTNYDTILDDFLEPYGRYPYHLHGGFSINHRNKDPDGRYSPNEARLIWGISAEEKYNNLKAGFDFSDFSFGSFRWGQSRLVDYFDLLGQGDYDEIQIIGFSGENDNHINLRIISNPHIKNVVYYVNPKSLNTLEIQVRSRLLFSGEKKTVNLKSWDEFWDRIKKLN